MNNTTPEKIKLARIQAGLTQTQAAAVLGRDLRTWQRWEAGDFAMDTNLLELFLLKTQKIS